MNLTELALGTNNAVIVLMSIIILALVTALIAITKAYLAKEKAVVKANDQALLLAKDVIAATTTANFNTTETRRELQSFLEVLRDIQLKVTK